MAEFAQVLESHREEADSVQVAFNRSQKSKGSNEAFYATLGESKSELGRSVRFRGGTPQQAAAYAVKLNEAINFVADLLDGRIRPHLFEEAMTTDDFPTLFGDIIDRQVFANYAEAPVTWPMLFRRKVVRDFRAAKWYYVEGGEDILEEVDEYAGYPKGNLTEGDKSISVRKYGRRMPFSWETIVNDDLDLLKDIPQRFGRAARRSEEKFATGLLVDATGPISSLFSTSGSYPNKIVDPLTVLGLQNAWLKLATKVDTEGEPIIQNGKVTIWVPPALQVVAQNIMNSMTVELTTSGGGTTEKLIAQNWINGNIKIAVGYYLPIVDESANKNTSWYMVLDPSNDRPAGAMGFLRGHEQPEIFMRSSNQVRVGGSSLTNPMSGDFDNDDLEYKIRHVFGGTALFSSAAVASIGTG